MWAGSACGPWPWPLEDGTPALDAVRSACRSLIDRSRPRLRHHHAPSWRFDNSRGNLRLNGCLNGLLIRSVCLVFRRHRRSSGQLRRSLCARSNRTRGCGWFRRGSDSNWYGIGLHTLDSRGRHSNFHRSRHRWRTVRRSVCMGLGRGRLGGCRRLRRCCMGRGRGSNHHGRTRNHRPNGRLARNRRRRCRGCHNLGVLPRQGYNPPWRGCRRGTRLQNRLGGRCTLDGRSLRWSGHGRGTPPQ